MRGTTQGSGCGDNYDPSKEALPCLGPMSKKAWRHDWATALTPLLSAGATPVGAEGSSRTGPTVHRVPLASTHFFNIQPTRFSGDVSGTTILTIRLVVNEHSSPRSPLLPELAP